MDIILNHPIPPPYIIYSGEGCREKISDYSTNNPQPCLDPQNQKGTQAKASFLSRENVLESYNLANVTAWWRVCSVGMRGCVCIRLGPSRNDKCSGESHWPVGRDSLTSQGSCVYAGAMS